MFRLMLVTWGCMVWLAGCTGVAVEELPPSGASVASSAEDLSSQESLTTDSNGANATDEALPGATLALPSFSTEAAEAQEDGRADMPIEPLLTAEPEGPTEETERYTYREEHDPNGTGKFYMGREIALVMGHQGIGWLERPEREEEEGLSLLMECLQVEPGSVVADIGAGSGVITTRLCEAVGEEGLVVAVDIQQEMLDALQIKCRLLGFRNVEPVLGTPRSPGLQPETIDMALMVDVYHEFDHPYEMLLEISRSLRPGGRVVFVEYRKEDPTVPIKEVHKMSEAQVLLEAGLPEFQLEWVETIDRLPWQHVIVFRRVEQPE